ncbi:myc protein [Episyrphus balteatus]|uniref:myc protein n=1 Tax=Episyrphus balteatus TaxID=286459 RepID=UPI0024869044|nr:myc protein [Episyrphus balteatus]XP_055846500.1 myc protein [Episyrphus balteatus]
MTQFYPSAFSSSNSLLEPDWTDSDAFGQGYGIISADPEELFEGLCSIPRSICDDIRLLESGGPIEFPGSENSDFDDTTLPEIRNYNCMWSGKCSPENRSSNSTSSDSNVSDSVPMAAIINNNHKMIATVIKTEPIDETENHLRLITRQSQQHQIQTQQQQQQNTNQQSMQKIPPGTSLLLNSRKTTTTTTTTTMMTNQQLTTQQQQQIHKKSKISNSIQNPVIQTTEFLRDRDLMASSYTSPTTFGRPDTPHSLEEDDDDATEFKHSYDLTACVMGSNNISLLDSNDPDKMMAINRLREQLEDTTTITTKIEPNHVEDGSLADVLSVIVKDSIYDKNCRIKEEDEGFFDRQYSSSSQQNNSSAGDWDSSDDASSFDGDATSLLSKRSGCSSSMSFSSSNVIGSNTAYPIKHSDHSYTRSKDGIDDISPNLETPSDSDEEIDVVSIGDKKLPTNPSDKDRRALQTKVAHKFSAARIVKTPGGIRTIPPRRRVSYDLPYTPNSSVSPIKSGSSLAASRNPSPTSTPYSSSSLYSSSSSSSSSKYHHHHHSSSSSRKRIAAANCSSIRTGGGGSVIINGSNSDEFMPPSKRNRGKKQKNNNNNSTTPSNVSSSSSSSSLKRHYSVDEVDTIEKRNLHNDMERQRRIGLKNLFEALKKQIPSIKDKERAPKVNILREAAKLCENLTREEQHLSDQKEMLKEQLRKRQEILNQLRSKQRC